MKDRDRFGEEVFRPSIDSIQLLLATSARDTRSRNNYYRTRIGISRSKYVGKKTLDRGHHNRLVAAPYRAPVWPWQSIERQKLRFPRGPPRVTNHYFKIHIMALIICNI